MARVLLCALILAAGTLSGCANPASIAERGSPRNTNPVAESPESSAKIAALGELARKAEQAGDGTAASRAYRQILELDSGNVDAHHHLAVIADQSRQFEQAADHYRAALERAPEDLDVRTSLAWSYLLQDRDAEAERELKGVLRQNPDHEIALCNLGWLYAKRGEEERALAMFRRGGTEDEARQALAEARNQRPTAPIEPAEVPLNSADLSAPSPRRGRRDVGKAVASRGTVGAVAALRPPVERTPTAIIEQVVPEPEASPAARDVSDAEPESQEIEAGPGLFVSDAEPPARLAPADSGRDESSTEPIASPPSKASPIIQAGHQTVARQPRLPPSPRSSGDPLLINPDELAAVGRAVILGKGRNTASRPAEPPAVNGEVEDSADAATVDPEFLEAARIGLNAALPPALQVIDSPRRDFPRRLKLTQR